jgi:hypothetical protein
MGTDSRNTNLSNQEKKRFAVLRKQTALLTAVVSVFAMVALGAPLAASAAQRIDMKVLVLGTSTTEPGLVSWQSALQREGVPYETIVTTPGHTPITAATLSDTLASGTPEGKYQAVIVTVGDLPECTTTCVSQLSPTEWTAIEEYEQTFNVRQLTGDIFPSATYGLNAPSFDGALDNTQGALTTEGKTIFPYLKGPVAIDTGTFGYEATPLTTQATGASFSSLVSGPGGSSLLGVYTHPNGVQEMVETFNQNANQLQAELLRHGALNWATRGVYFGDQRNYYEADIDDNFLFDDSWDTTTHTTDSLSEDAIREVPADVEYAAKWSTENKFRIDMLFNGGGSTAYAEGNTAALGGSGGATGETTKGGGSSAPGTDPLLAAFQKDKSSFGWISHTWDHPNIDVGCATQQYIEAELNENNSWAAQAPGTTPGTGGLGLTSLTTPTAALGNDNPSVVITGEHSGLANLLPGNPGVVDPPDLDTAEAAASGGKLAPGKYVYAVADDFSVGGPPSTASESAPVTVTGSTGTVTLTWAAVCHAAEFKIYRELEGSNKWSLISTVAPPATAPPNSWFGNPISNKLVTNGGALEQTFTDTGAAGTASTGPPVDNGAVESAYPQNPNFTPAFTGVGIQYFGSDASKPYPNASIAGSTTPVYPAGSSFPDGTASAIPRYPTNIYYNVSTETEEVDEYNTLYTSVVEGGKCVASPTNTCETAKANFAEVVHSIETNMFGHVMGNDPRPHYFHQPNMMGSPPVGEPTTGTPPATSKDVGNGLFYSVVNPMLAAYNQYFSAPIEQPTMAQIGEILARQQAWNTASASQVSGYIEGNQVTLNNTGTAAVNAPLTGVTGVGSVYGGIQSGWTSVPVAASTYVTPTTWPAAPAPVQQAPQGSWLNQVGSAGYLLGGWDGAQDVSDMPNVTASVVQGSRYVWAANTTDVRALQGPEGTTRNAAGYYDPNQVQVKLGFTTAYSGNLHLYAMDWDSTARRESITVNDGSGPRTVLLNSEFSNGAWVSFPVNVAAGGSVTISVNHEAGANAVLSGIFLGDAGAPPSTTGQQLSEGGWLGAVGSGGYDLAGWDGPTGDVSYVPNASISLVQGSRYQWASHTEDARALSEPGAFTRNAAAYYDPNQIQVQIHFTAAYTGNLHTYAVDWDTTARRETISVNGQTAVLSSSFNLGAWVSFPISVAAGGTVTITVDRTAGPNAVLSGIFLGEGGATPGPTVASAPQGAWVNAVGSAGYDLPGWNGSAGDLSYLPNASASLVQGSRYQWAAGSSEARVLSDPSGVTRNAGVYYDPNEVQVQLHFSAAYSGNLHLYAVDWDKLTRREIITVNGQSAVLSNDFGEGAWVAFPVTVAAGGTVTITVDRTFGPNAVLSGIFLGDAGAPAAAPVASAPQGNWVGSFGSAGYALGAWDGSTDLTSLPNASLAITQGTRYQWAPTTTDVRALEGPEKMTRTAAAYYDPNQIDAQLTFKAAYSGNLELYAVDWDSTARRETIVVNGQTAVLSNEFSQGAWVSFPISVQAGETVNITVNRLAGSNAVLSGIFLG